LAIPRGCADLRDHGAAHGCSWRRAGYALLGRAWCVTAERNGPNVRADERIPFDALAETDLPPTKRCPPVVANELGPLALTVFFRRMSGRCIVAAAVKNRPTGAR
jgi:hypothetical protein